LCARADSNGHSHTVSHMRADGRQSARFSERFCD
jgi:hypothetical protein